MARIGDGIQNDQVVLVDQGTLVIAEGAAASVAVVEGDVASLDSRVAALEALVAPSYGEVYENNEAGTAITLTSSAAYYQWVSGTAGAVKGAPFVTENDSTLVIGASGAGVYRLALSFSGDLNVHADIEATVKINNAVQPNIRSDQHTFEDDTYCTGTATGLVTLAAGDVVSAWFQASSNTKTWTVKHVTLTIHRIDP